MVRPTFKYYGWGGYGNFGDDLLKRISQLKGFNFSDTSDNLLINGGTILPIHPNQLLFKWRLKNFNPKNVVVYGSGVTDPPKKEELEFTREYLKNCKHIGIRDEQSRQILGMGTVIGDPFFHMYFIQLPLNHRKDYVVVNVGTTAEKMFGDENDQRHYIEQMLIFCKTFIIDTLHLKIVIPILHPKFDKEVVSYFCNYLGTKNVKIIEKQDMLTYMKSARFAITFKQHAFIIALCTGTPVIPIAYHSKTINVANDFNIKAIKLKEVTYDSLFNYYNTLDNFPLKRINNKIKEYNKLGNNFVKKVMEDFKNENKNRNI